MILVNWTFSIRGMIFRGGTLNPITGSYTTDGVVHASFTPREVSRILSQGRAETKRQCQNVSLQSEAF